MSSKKNDRERERLRRDIERFEALKAELAQVGLFRRGSLTQIYARCGSPRCPCQKDPSRRHGPYVQWTRKLGGKTVTVRLRRGREPLFEQWIANCRRLDDLLRQMQQVSLRATEAILRLEDEDPGGPGRASGVKERPAAEF